MVRMIRRLSAIGLVTLVVLLVSGCAPFVRNLQTSVLRGASPAVATPTVVEIIPISTSPTAMDALAAAPAPTNASAATPVLSAETLSNEQVDAIMDVAEALTIQVYERVSPSVVNITTQVMQMGFYGVFPSEGTGSGFFIDQEGHILTNYHVIDGAQSIEVTLLDQTAVKAEVVGSDPLNDLAVLKVNVAPEEIVPVDMSFQGELKVGMRAIAIGNPFGLDWTLTSGVISSLGRPIQVSDEQTIYDVVQTDAAINPGNSGGPLLNSRGQLIGVNAAIQSQAENIGFAIPLSTVRRVVPELLEKGYYSHPWLGFAGYRVSPELARQLDLPVDKGVLIARVYAGSPAEEAGLRGANREVYLGNVRILTGGDILVTLDDTPIESNAELSQYLETRTRVGQQLTATVYRGNEQYTTQLIVGEQPR